MSGPFTRGDQLSASKLNGIAADAAAAKASIPNSVMTGDSGTAARRRSTPSLLPSSFIPCLLRRVGGLPGDESTQCSYTYDGWPDDELSQLAPFTNTTRRIFIAQQPMPAFRASLGAYSQAPDNSLGMYYVDPSDVVSFVCAFHERRLCEAECP